MKNLASEFVVAGKPLDDDELIGHILRVLGSSYNTLKTTINANPGTTLFDLFSQLHAFDQLNNAYDVVEGFSSSANMER
jgi:hypothetical protein